MGQKFDIIRGVWHKLGKHDRLVEVVKREKFGITGKNIKKLS